MAEKCIRHNFNISERRNRGVISTGYSVEECVIQQPRIDNEVCSFLLKCDPHQVSVTTYTFPSIAGRRVKDFVICQNRDATKLNRYMWERHNIEIYGPIIIFNSRRFVKNVHSALGVIAVKYHEEQHTLNMRLDASRRNPLLEPLEIDDMIEKIRPLLLQKLWDIHVRDRDVSDRSILELYGRLGYL